MVDQEPAAEIFAGRCELARSRVSEHRQTRRKPHGLRLILEPHHPNRNETANRHSMDTRHPVNGHRPKELIPAVILNAGNKNKREIHALPQLPSYRRPPAVCR